MKMTVYAICGPVGCDIREIASQLVQGIDAVNSRPALLLDADEFRQEDGKYKTAELISAINSAGRHVVVYGHSGFFDDELNCRCSCKIFVEKDLDLLFGDWLQAQVAAGTEIEAAISLYFSKIKPENEHLSKFGYDKADFILPKGLMPDIVRNVLVSASKPVMPPSEHEIRTRAGAFFLN